MVSGDLIDWSAILKQLFLLLHLLYFKNPRQAETFKKGKINSEDNYLILDSISEETEILDQVLLSTPYISTSENTAYERAELLIKSFQKK